MSRRWRRAAGLGLVGLLVFGSAVIVVLQSDWLRDRLRRVAISQADKYLSVDLTIGRLSGSLWHGIVLDGVRLSQPDGTLLEAPRVSVRYDAWTLIQRHVVLSQIVVERPVVRLVQGLDGWNVSRLLKPRPKTGASVDVQIDRLTIDHADLTVAPLTGAARHLTDASVEGRLTRIGGDLSFDLASTTLHDGPSGYSLRRANGTLRNSGRAIDLLFAADRQAASFSGRVRLSLVAGAADLDASVDLIDVDLRSFLADPTWESAVTAHVHAQGRLAPRIVDSTLTFEVTASHATALGYEGTGLVATGRWAAGRSTFDGSATAYGGAATIRAEWQIVPNGPTQPAFDGAGSFNHVSLTALPKRLQMPPLASQLAGRYQVHEDGAGWHANVTLADSTVEDAAVARGTMGSVDGRGGAVFYAASGSLAGLNLQRLAGPLDLPSLAADRYRSRLSGTFAMSGREMCRACAIRRLIEASAEIEDATVADTRITRASARLSLVGSGLTIEARGNVAHLDAEAMGWRTATELDLNGSMDGSVTLPDAAAVTVKALEVSGTAELGPSTIVGVTIDRAHGVVSLRDGLLTVRELMADGSGLHLSAKGAVAVGDAGASALDLTVGTDDLAALGKLIRQPLAGAGHVEAHVTGPHDQPQVSGTVSLRQLAYRSEASALTFNGDLAISMPQWRMSDLTARLNGASTFVQVKSFHATTVTGQVTYRAGRIGVDADLADATRQLRVAGDIGLAAADRTWQVHTLALTTKGETWALPATSIATVRMTGSRIDVGGLTLAHGTSSISIDGAVPWISGSTTGPDVLTARVHQVDLADLDHVLLGTGNLKGLVEAKATLTGALDDPRIEGSVNVTDGAIQSTPFASFDGRVTLARQDLTVDVSLVQSGTNQLRAVGHVPVGGRALSSGRPMDVSITSTPIDLGLAALLTTNLSRVSGTSELNLHLTGSPRAPVVDGTVNVEGGAFTLVGSGVSYRKAAAAMTFKANHLTVDALQFQDDDGHELHATGGLDLFGDPTKRALDVHITTNGMHVLNNDLGTLQLNADAHLTGDLSAPAIAGTVTLESGRLQVDQILKKTTKGAYSETPEAALPMAAVAPEATSPAPAPTRATDRLSVDLQVNLPDNLVMRGRNLRASDASIGLGDMNVIAGGQLHVVKPAGGELDVIGHVQIVRGTYTFQGRRFDVARGSDVLLRGADLFNAALNVSADREVNGIDATVHVTGTPRRPQVSLSSQPPLDEAEILSLIVFGQSVGDLGQTQRTALADSATAMAAGTLTNPLADSVARALDLDTFEILAPSATEQVPVVSLGSTIGSSIYVGFKQELGGASGAVSFEYRFTRFLKLVTSFAQGALQSHVLERAEAAGVDLLFVFRF